MPQNTGWHTELLANRKEAVLQICRWAQTRRQFENMVQHMAADGGKGDFSANYQALLEFMKPRYGIGDDYDSKLQALYAQLPSSLFRCLFGYSAITICKFGVITVLSVKNATKAGQQRNKAKSSTKR